MSSQGNIKRLFSLAPLSALREPKSQKHKTSSSLYLHQQDYLLHCEFLLFGMDVLTYTQGTHRVVLSSRISPKTSFSKTDYCHQLTELFTIFSSSNCCLSGFFQKILPNRCSPFSKMEKDKQKHTDMNE